jgi:hypothetical protein
LLTPYTIEPYPHAIDEAGISQIEQVPRT